MGKIKWLCLILISFLLATDAINSVLGTGLFTLVILVYLGVMMLLTKGISGKLVTDKTQFNKLFDIAYMTLIPFTIFAFVGKYYLGFESVQAFVTTGIMGSSGLLSAESVKLTNKKKTIVLLVTLLGFLTFFGLMQLSGWLKEAAL